MTTPPSALGHPLQADKLQILESIIMSKSCKDGDRIAAISAHNEMVGDNAPQKITIELGPETLAALEKAVARIEAFLIS